MFNRADLDCRGIIEEEPREGRQETRGRTRQTRETASSTGRFQDLRAHQPYEKRWIPFKAFVQLASIDESNRGYTS